jgi:hypothetical protein
MNFWFPLPRSGRREVGRLPRLLVVRGGCRGPEPMGIITWKHELLVVPFSGEWAA